MLLALRKAISVAVYIVAYSILNVAFDPRKSIVIEIDGSGWVFAKVSDFRRTKN